MRSLLRRILNTLDPWLFRYWVKWCWPEYKRPRTGYMRHYQLIRQYFFWQKILRVNGSVPWPVDFRSKIVDWPKIDKGICSDPGDNPGIYINAAGGLKLGNNVNIGQNTIITTTNHYKYDHRKLSTTTGVEIGDNVWIGANCSIVAGSVIGSNVTIGAGCYIKGEIPSDVTVIQSAATIEIIPKKRGYEWDVTKERLI